MAPGAVRAPRNLLLDHVAQRLVRLTGAPVKGLRHLLGITGTRSRPT